jgi:serine/threonine protein kinase/tetratricopeptide (TPR) repeat protein
MNDDLSGRTIGRYQVLERLGRGGMAEVYRAYQPSLDRYVAIKVIFPHLASDPALLERFGREARAVAALQHPNIVQVHDFDVQDNNAFMAMEFVSGPTLKAALQELQRRGQLLPFPVIGQIVGQIADALGYAHDQHVVHRDVKPANVLIRRREPDGDPVASLLQLAPNSVVLTDFGVARIIKDSVEQTATGTILGSPAYMSPEQGRGERVDARSDIYSLGIVLFELVTGRVPFDADTPLAIVLKHTNSPLPPPRSLRPDLPEELERVLLRALAKEPADRFQNAAAFGAAVREHCGTLGTQPIQLVPIPTGGPHTVLDQPAPAPERATRLVVTDSETSMPTAAADRKSRRWPAILGGLAVIILLLLGGIWALQNSRGSSTPVAGDAAPTAADAGQPAAATAGEPPDPAMDAPTTAAGTTTDPTVPAATPLPAELAATIDEAYAACPAHDCSGGNADQALTLINTALAAEPDSAALLAARALIYARWDPWSYPDQIEADVTQALAREPNNATAYLARGLALARTAEDDSQYGAALENFDQAIAYDPDLIDAYLERAALLSDTPDYYEAGSPARRQVVDDTSRVLAQDPRNIPALYLRGLAYANGNEYEAALTDFSTAIDLVAESDPESIDLRMQRANLYHYYIEDPQAALDDLSSVIANHPDYTEALQERVILLAELGNFEDSLSDAELLVERAPTDPLAYILRGSLFLTQALAEAAIADFDRALLIGDPENPLAHYGRGRALLELGEPEDAIPNLEIAASAADDLYLLWYTFFEGRVLAHFDLGQAYLALGRSGEALQAANAAIEANGDWYRPFLLRGQVLAGIGDTDAARESLLEALQLAENADERAEVEAALEALP